MDIILEKYILWQKPSCTTWNNHEWFLKKPLWLSNFHIVYFQSIDSYFIKLLYQKLSSIVEAFDLKNSFTISYNHEDFLKETFWLMSFDVFYDFDCGLDSFYKTFVFWIEFNC